MENLCAAHISQKCWAQLISNNENNSCSVYEKLLGTADINSDVFRLCIGHFHVVLDIFFFK